MKNKCTGLSKGESIRKETFKILRNKKVTLRVINLPTKSVVVNLPKKDGEGRESG